MTTGLLLARLSKHIKSLRAEVSGVAAIEFSILAPVFLALLFGGFEIGLLFTRIVMLDDATTKLSKLVYIGEVADGVFSGSFTSADFENLICDRVSLMFPNCADNLTIEMTPINSFQNIPKTDAVCHDKDVELKPAVSFNPGGGSTIVFMRACMTIDLITPGIGLGLALTKTENGRFQVISTATFMNEPF